MCAAVPSYSCRFAPFRFSVVRCAVAVCFCFSSSCIEDIFAVFTQKKCICVYNVVSACVMSIDVSSSVQVAFVTCHIAFICLRRKFFSQVAGIAIAHQKYVGCLNLIRRRSGIEKGN